MMSGLPPACLWSADAHPYFVSGHPLFAAVG
jgi:hypothetical protein